MYPKLASEVRIDPDMLEGHRIADALLDPVLSGAVADDARWEPDRGAWLGGE